MVRRILVTGANKGIGLAIVNRCLQDHSDTHVVMGCRSAQRGDAAKASLVSSNPEWSDRLTVLQMDTGEDESVAAAARTLRTMLGDDPPPLYAIVNNAGMASSNVSETLNVNVRGASADTHAILSLPSDFASTPRGVVRRPEARRRRLPAAPRPVARAHRADVFRRRIRLRLALRRRQARPLHRYSSQTY